MRKVLTQKLNMINKETGNKKFLKTIETLFSENVSHKEKTNLVKNDTILSDDQSSGNACYLRHFFIGSKQI